ncbi:unnamed protein product [Tilletia laevis]|uniref:Uncharacterized protein n=2 Tax=Tilletia TaxID=13289 RepID=A0A177V8I2_9BASI|nr:hypothetical protein CF336_g5086 [Tilletia laevis]KAE8258557.1 hypothetical protein A4X03_0g4340 [Tilletia caries]KAE8198756.1 hypothetical protein CF335_g4319 [Tilletia laevis]CAD6889203.1 unnamed protein product [Tilletia caries]CAD6927328.1 unnamed protein product [Tilletia caries]
MTDADVEAFMANYIHLSINDDDADTSSSATYMPIVATNHSDTILPTLVSPSFVSGPSLDWKPPQRLVHNQHFSSSSATSTSIGSYQSGSSSQPRNNFFTQRNVPIRETPRPLTAIMPPFPFIDSSFVPYRAVGSLMQRSPEGIIVREFWKTVVTAFRTIAITHPDPIKGAEEQQDLGTLLSRFKGRRRGVALLTEASAVIHFEGFMLRPHRAVRPNYALRLSSSDHPYYAFQHVPRSVNAQDQFPNVNFVVPGINPQHI